MPDAADLIHEISTTEGTGNLTVSAVNGRVRFSDSTYGFGTGGSDVFDYFISNRAAAEWEYGTGSMSDANTLVRDTVITSSNSDAAVDFSAGTKDVTNDVPAATQNAALRQGTHTIWVPASAMVPAITSGAAAAQLEATSNAQNYRVLDFDASSDEYAHFQVAMPDSWDEGTVTFQAFWSTTATDTDGVAWGLQGVANGDGDPIDASWGTAVVVTDVGQSAAGDVLVTSESAAVTIAGTPAAGDVCFFRLLRDVSNGSDTMTEDARLIGIKLFITLDAPTD